MILGVISDTHGLLRPEVLRIFKGVGLIVHAGDIGSPEILDELRTIAEVIAVRGNNDTAAWAKRIPQHQLVHAGGVSIYVLHDVKELKQSSLEEKVDVVISGHSHKPSIDRRDGVLFLNPGSAGPRRFKLPIAVARLIVRGRSVRPEVIALA